MKDKFFIFVSAVLIVLFAVSVLENMSFVSTSFEEDAGKLIVRAGPPESVESTLTRLEEAGLEPREAKYFKVIDE